MLSESDLAKLREMRTRQDMVLKPSPYLKKTFVNDSGEEAEIKVRNYQAQMIMNLLMVETFLNGDDTGLGKTLEVLSAIGYVWLQEPEYVPIIITTKSALFQWEAEVGKFMHGIECVTVSGEPFRRHEQYEEFFERHDPSKKRLLILTYDNVMYDAEDTVIRGQPKKAKDLPKGFNKAMTEARQAYRKAEADLEREKGVAEDKYAGAPFEVQEFVRVCGTRGYVQGPFPGPWIPEDTALLEKFIVARKIRDDAKKLVEDMKEEQAPTRRVTGIVARMEALCEAHPTAKLMLVMDEMHKLKNYRSQFHEKTRAMGEHCARKIGMTATPVKNRLMEFFALFRILRPELFPKVTHFQNDFCVTQLQKVAGNRQVPIVVGYKNLDEFVRRIEPFFLSRKKHDVAKELPELISVEVECELSQEQDDLYDMAEAGLLDEIDDPDADGSETLRATTACLQAVNAPQLLLNDEGVPFEGESAKLEALMDLLEGEAAGSKVIVYSKFERMITLIEERLHKCTHCGKQPRDHDGDVCPGQTKRKKDKYKAAFPCVRITGKENDAKVRRKHATTFQNPESGVNVVLITNAGSESVNLQAAEHFVFFDLPWSYGDYLQLIGRMIRIGSSHVTVVAHHFLGRRRGSGKSTIDHHVLKALKVKKKLADKVAGENLKDALTFKENDAVLDILSALQAEHKGKERTKKRLPRQDTSDRDKVLPPPPPPPQERTYLTGLDFSDL